MDQVLLAAVWEALAVVVGMLLFLEIGRRLGRRLMARDPEGARAGTGAVDGAVLGLLALLIAFTFSGAASRFDTRRHLIVEEANDIGTAYLRLDMLPAEAQPALRESFRRYVDSRLRYHKGLGDRKASEQERANSGRLQGEIWRQAMAAIRAPGALPAAPMMVLPALNAMCDIATTQAMATKLHPPRIIFTMLIGVALASALLAGLAMAGGKRRDWYHILMFALVVGLTVYVILDIEYPREGLIRIDAFDQAMVELREGMK
jgi:hypothetical protein